MDRMSHIFGWFQRMQTGSKPVPVSLIPFSARSSAKSETESHGSRNRKPKARTPEPDDDEEEPDHTKKPTPEDPKGKTPLSPPSAAATEVKPLETYINALRHHVVGEQSSNGDLVHVFPGSLSDPQRYRLANTFWKTVRSLLELQPEGIIPWSTYYDRMIKSAVVKVQPTENDKSLAELMKVSFNLNHIVVTPDDDEMSILMKLPLGVFHFGTQTWLGRTAVRKTWLELLRQEYLLTSQPEYKWYAVMLLTGQQLDDIMNDHQKATKGTQFVYTDLSKWNKKTIEEHRDERLQLLSDYNKNSKFNSQVFQCQWDYIQLMFFSFAVMPECYGYYDVVSSMVR
jgi:hypothetical protein